MRHCTKRWSAVLGVLTGLAIAAVAAEPAAVVSRKDLLTAIIDPARPVTRVEIKEVTLPPGMKAPLHLHPCAVVGVVREGRIAYQRVGEAVQHLGPGEVFYEPANAHVSRFDNEGEGAATFTAFYLLGPGEQELIRLLKPASASVR